MNADIEANYARCACCGEQSLKEGGGSFEICPICGWEDDPVQNDDPNLDGGANGFSLQQWRKIYRMSCRVFEHYTLDLWKRAADIARNK